MNTMAKTAMVCLAGVMLAGVALAAEEKVVAAAPEAAKKTSQTLENLNKAFNGESNAKARYEAFATKADEEGFKGAASLFRAAAASESIHIAKHAKMMKALGAEAKAVIEKADVKSTKENIEAAMKGETEEATNMYPEFAKKATEEKDKKAAIVFEETAKVEAKHAEMYKALLADLDNAKEKKGYAVCPDCGYTLPADADIKKCPVCAEPRKKFSAVE